MKFTLTSSSKSDYLTIVSQFCAISLVLTAISLASEPASESCVDETAIQGTWKVVSSKYDGRDVDKFVGSECTFDGKFMITKTNERMVKDEYKLDSSKTLKLIDITGKRDNKLVLIVGIYSLDHDTLMLCHGDPGKPRPTEFVTKRGDKRSLAVLKRIKK